MKKFLSVFSAFAAAVMIFSLFALNVTATDVTSDSVPLRTAETHAICQLPEPVELPSAVPEERPLRFLSSRSVLSEADLLGELESLITDAVRSGENRVDVSHLEIMHGDMNLYTVQYYSPYLCEGINITPYYQNSYYSYISITNNLTKEETEKYFAEVDKKISGIKNLLLESETQLERALLLHDYLAYNAEYDYENYLNGTIPQISYRSAGVLMNGVGVCQSYAYAYMYMLKLAGMDAHVVTSDSMNHAWNEVEIDGQYYHVDVTWDDPVPDSLGRVYHTYFLKSDSAFSEGDSSIGMDSHYGWDESAPDCTSTLYDSAYWNNVSSGIVSHGKNSYYISGNSIVMEKGSGHTGNGSEFVPLGKWSLWGGGGSWVGAFSGLVLIGNELYYNTATEIRKIDVVTLEDTLVLAPDTSYGYIYGSAVYGDTLRYFISTKPNGEREYYSVDNITQVVLNKNKLSLNEGEKFTLIPSINAAELTWTTSDPSVVTVTSDGVVTAVSQGTAEVKVTAGNGSYAICEVKVIHVHDKVYHFGRRPTCTSDGWEAYETCTKCAYTTYKVIAAEGHKEAELQVKDATCTESGTSAGVYCTVCRLILVTQTETSPKGHSFGEWTELIPPTEFTEGTRCHTCTVCGFTESVSIPTTDHVHSYDEKEVKSATCTEVGFTTHKCSCGDSYTDDHKNPLGHDLYVYRVITESSCTSRGEEIYCCRRCDYYETAYLPLLDHAEVKVEGKESTCTEGGFTESIICTVCNGLIVPPHDTEPLGHDFEDEWTVDVEPTYELEGEKSRHCTRCDEKCNVIVIAKLVLIIDSSEKFVDLEVKSWSKDGIDYVVSYGYMNGTGNGTTFDQTGTMTRAMIVSVLYRMAGKPVSQAENPFTDLEAGQTWYHDAVIWAYEHGIVTGTSKVTFNPTGAVTREQMAAFLYRYAGYMGYDTSASADLSGFPDTSKVGSWALEAFSWANAEGLITGAKGSDGITRLDGQGMATREQVATILMRFCKKVN